jgi:hypothetical protein
MWQVQNNKSLNFAIKQTGCSCGYTGIYGFARLLAAVLGLFAYPVSAGLDISVPSDTGAYTLSWSAPEKGYSTLKQLVGPGQYRVIDTGADASISFEKAPGIYQYRLDEYGCTFGCSVVRISYEKVLVPPRVPGDLQVRPADVADTYILRWKASSGANWYVLQASQNDGPWSNVYTSSSNQIVLPVKGAGIFRYRVQACGPFIGCSRHSSAASIGIGNLEDTQTPLEVASNSNI